MTDTTSNILFNKLQKYWKRLFAVGTVISGIIVFFVKIVPAATSYYKENMVEHPRFYIENPVLQVSDSILIIRPDNNTAREGKELNLSVGETQLIKKGLLTEDTMGVYWIVPVRKLGLPVVSEIEHYKVKAWFIKDEFDDLGAIIVYNHINKDTLGQSHPNSLANKNSQTKDKSDKQPSNGQPNVSVTSNNQSGGITAYQVSIYEKELEKPIQEILTAALTSINPIIFKELENKNYIKVFIKESNVNIIRPYFEKFREAKLIDFKDIGSTMSGGIGVKQENVIYDIRYGKDYERMNMYCLIRLDNFYEISSKRRSPTRPPQ